VISLIVETLQLVDTNMLLLIVDQMSIIERFSIVISRVRVAEKISLVVVVVE
jgi:hypothetical protein